MSENAKNFFRPKIALAFFAAIFSLAVSVLKFKSGEINYVNSDATWHALYTMKCYDETPAKTHKFLPIVSLGGEGDKWISWGACIPDKAGNFYYTSFSPAGYALPYFFIKFFRLNFDEKSLYIFNTILFLISAILLSQFLLEIFGTQKISLLVCALGVLAYSTSPEILHGMGIVYWHHSIVQAAFLIQVYAYFVYKKRGSKTFYAIFLFSCLTNPYIEWTGYVANAGFAFCELFSLWKKNPKVALFCAEQIALFSILSFSIFCFHYLQNVFAKDFFVALKNRFFARNFSTSIPIKNLIFGYWTSFKFLWILLFVIFSFCAAIIFLKKIKFEKKKIAKIVGGGGYYYSPFWKIL